LFQPRQPRPDPVLLLPGHASGRYGRLHPGGRLSPPLGRGVLALAVLPGRGAGLLRRRPDRLAARPATGHRRGEPRLPRAPPPRAASLAEYLQLLRTRTLLLIILAQTFAVIILIPLLHFGKRFFMERHQLTEEQAGLSMGVMALAAGVLGTGLSGVLGDWLAR